jgi:hypothetical protein
MHSCSNSRPKCRIRMYELTHVAETATFSLKNIWERVNIPTELVRYFSRDTSNEVFMKRQLEYKNV